MKRILCVTLCLLAAIFFCACREPEGISSSPTATEFEQTYDIDLTVLNSTMVYSQVNDLMVNYEDHIGQTVKMSGILNVFETEERTYYTCLISDAAACCSQGLEFRLQDGFVCPESGTDVTVGGVFDVYYEGDTRYYELTDAVLF